MIDQLAKGAFLLPATLLKTAHAVIAISLFLVMRQIGSRR